MLSMVGASLLTDLLLGGGGSKGQSGGRIQILKHKGGKTKKITPQSFIKKLKTKAVTEQKKLKKKAKYQIKKRTAKKIKGFMDRKYNKHKSAIGKKAAMGAMKALSVFLPQ